MSDESKTPHCDRWADHHKEALAILDFLAWLRSEQGPMEGSFDPPGLIDLAWYGPSSNQFIRFFPGSREHLVMKFLGVDPAEIEKERREMLHQLTATESPNPEPGA